MASETIPAEFSFGWVYVPPLMVIVVMGFAATYLLTRFLNASGLSRYFWRPEIAFLGIWATLTSLLGLFVIPP